MMPYIVGKDPETNEVLIGDVRTNTFFLRGPASEEKTVVDFVEAANMWIHSNVKPTQEPHCECHERDASYVCEYCRLHGLRGHMER